MYKKNNKIITNQKDGPYYMKMPSPDFDLINPGDYDMTNPDTIIYQYSRGCSYSCSFCVDGPVIYQMKPVDLVIKDLINLANLGVKVITLHGTIITTNTTWLKIFCEKMIENKVPVFWSSSARANDLTREKLIMMRKAGCVGLYIGVESTKQHILDKVNKTINRDIAKNAVLMCREEGIPATIPFLFNIGETDEDVKDYVDFVLESKPAHVSITLTKAYKGTDLYAKLQDKISYHEYGSNAIDTAIDVENSLKRMKNFRKEISEKSKHWKNKIIWILTNKHAMLVYKNKFLNKNSIRNKEMRSALFTQMKRSLTFGWLA